MSGFRVSAWSIRNPIPVTVLFIGLLIAGVAAFGSLPIKLLPNTSIPLVSVSVTQSGAAAAEMENQVARPLESAVASVAGVKHINSTVVQGAATISIEFELGTDLQKAVDDVRSAVDRARVLLPQGIDPPTVQRVDFDSAPVLTYAVSAPEMTAPQLSWFIDDTVSRALQGGRDVAQVTRIGGVDQEINVILDPARMAALGVTAPQINSVLAQVSLDDSGGRAALDGGEQTIRVLGAAANVEQIQTLSLPLADGRFVALADVATVEQGAEEERSFARLDGRPVAGFQVMKSTSGSDVTAERSVHQAIAKLQAAHPGVIFTEVMSTAKQTRGSFDSTLHVLIEGMVLAAIVVFAFLKEWRATLIAAIAMPLSLIPTFAAMALLGFSLNGLTLLALTLVIGILVDDAIVEIENIEKRIEGGMTPYRASLVGADAIGLAVVATTGAIVAVFTPVSFMGGVAGQFFREFGLTVAVAVAFSLLVARLVTPVLTAYFLKRKDKPHVVETMPGAYRRVLDWALGHRWLTALLGALAVVAAMGLAATRPIGFQPTDDSGFFYVTLTAAPGGDTPSMQAAVDQASAILLRQPETERVLGVAADGGKATLTVVLKDERERTTDAFIRAARPLLRTLPDVRVATQTGFAGADVIVTLTGDDPAALARTQTQLMQEMAGLPQISGARPAPSAAGVELVIRPKPQEAARLGVSAQALASVLRVATLGDIDAIVAKFSQGEHRIPIRVRLPREARADLDQLGDLRVPTRDGKSTPLSSVADLRFEPGPGEIVRQDRRRRVSVEADLEGVTAGQAFAAIHALPVFKRLPPGVREVAAGDQEQTAEALSGFVWAIFAGVFLIYGVMVLLFRSFFKPITILTALPLVALGAFAALTLADMPVTLPVLIGLLMLLGLAGKNSILLVEFIIERERAGESRFQAIHDACRERARPIVMTTLAMIAGMAPTALGLGEGAAFRQPMSIAVIGGLVSSTILSLVLVPSAYEIIDDLELWLKQRLRRLVTAKSPGDDDPIPDEAQGVAS
jgi:HAE1 family hydrophobic/amphiphilic exporter-1